jgi:hypothetical protein
MRLQAADISNVVKPFAVAQRWALRVTDEFFLQGDLERERGMVATPACDRRTQSRVALQRGFIDFVCLKLFAPLARAFPAAGAPLLAQLHANRAAWARCTDAELALARDWRDPAAPDQPAAGGGGGDGARSPAERSLGGLFTLVRERSVVRVRSSPAYLGEHDPAAVAPEG